MAVRVIAQLLVVEPDGVDRYVEQVCAVVERYGGKCSFNGEITDTLEGRPAASIAAVHEFDDHDALYRWYESDEYGPLRQIRQRSSISSLIVVG
jgi:uncharacterized protein (DUF1330 family)